jgi:HSP20 family protein
MLDDNEVTSCSPAACGQAACNFRFGYRNSTAVQAARRPARSTRLRILALQGRGRPRADRTGLSARAALDAATADSRKDTNMATPVKHNDTGIERWTPAAEFNRISQELSQLFDDQWSLSAVARQGGFVPLADLEETDDAYLVDVELPGLKKKDVHVETDGRRIAVSGERKEQQRSGLLRRHTRSWGQFRYEVVLPDEVDGDHIEAAMNDGVLQLRVPKLRTGQQRRQIEVK